MKKYLLDFDSEFFLSVGSRGTCVNIHGFFYFVGLYFYARKQNASRVFAIVWASVRPSVCHTRDLYQNGAS